MLLPHLFLLPPHVLFDHVRLNVEFKFIVFVEGAPLLQPRLFCDAKTTTKTTTTQGHQTKKTTSVQPPHTFNTTHSTGRIVYSPRSFEVVVCSLIFNSKSRTAVDWFWSKSRVNMFGSPYLPFSLCCEEQRSRKRKKVDEMLVHCTWFTALRGILLETNSFRDRETTINCTPQVLPFIPRTNLPGAVRIFSNNGSRWSLLNLHRIL